MECTKVAAAVAPALPPARRFGSFVNRARDDDDVVGGHEQWDLGINSSCRGGGERRGLSGQTCRQLVVCQLRYPDKASDDITDDEM